MLNCPNLMKLKTQEMVKRIIVICISGVALYLWWIFKMSSCPFYVHNRLILCHDKFKVNKKNKDVTV